MKQRLLIVDDEKNIVDALTRTLSGLGVELLATYDPTEAFEIVRNTDPDVVISDLKMPRMDGLQLLRKIKEFDSAIQVVIITGHGSPQEADKAIQEGAYDFLHKPFNKKDIVAVVHRAFEKVSLLRENLLLRERLKKNHLD